MSYTYDANGNMTQAVFGTGAGARTVSCVYDGFGRLKKVNDNGKETEYTYDADGLRSSKSTGGSTERYIYDNGQLVFTLVPAATNVYTSETTTSYIRGLGLIASRAGSTPTYYHYDAHGNVIQTTDANGNLVKNYYYDAFGVEQNADPADTNPFRYCGEQYDTETGNYYLRARYYTPGTGRFTQEDTHWNPQNMIYGDNPQKWNEYQREDDPLGLHTYTYKPDFAAVTQAGNLYGYGLNNPVMYVDADGEIAASIAIGAAEVAASGETMAALEGLAVAAGYLLTEQPPMPKLKNFSGIGEQMVISTIDGVMPDINDAITQYSPHRKVNKRTKNKHQEAESRRQRDHRGEKGDDRRPVDRGNKSRR